MKGLALLLTGVGILLSVVMITLLVGDVQDFDDAWADARWTYLPGIVFLSALNHLIRYGRWQRLLKHVSAISFQRRSAALPFFAGSLLIFTPGRVGEAAKSVYARDYLGIPVSQSLPVLIAERLGDVMVMALLASIGLLLLGETPSLLVGGVVTATILAILVLRTSLLTNLARNEAFRYRCRRVGEFLEQAGTAQKSLFMKETLVSNFGFGATAWLLEVAIFFLSLKVFGAEPEANAFVLALALFPLASLGGSLSFLPGGIGVTEAGLTALGVLVGDLAEETAVLAALLTRLAISGVIVVSGVAAVILLRRVPRWQ